MPFEFDLTNERTRYKAIILVLAVLLFISLIALTIVSVKLAKVNDSIESTTTDSLPADTSDTTTDIEDTTTTTEPPIEDLYNSVPVLAEDVNRGYLVLVDDTHPFVSSEASSVVVVREKKTSSYKVSDYSIKLRAEVVTQLNSAMDDMYAATGCSDVMISMAYTADNNVIDRATGLSFKLVVYDGKDTYRIISDTVEASDKYSDVKNWLLTHMHEYGFILRYPDEFADVTGKSQIGALFRYVGVEAATLIYNENTCLESFLTKITAYTYDNPWIFENINGGEYKAYYHEASAEVTTHLVNVPADADVLKVYGDNKLGFVIIAFTENDGTDQENTTTSSTAEEVESSPQN